MPTRFVWQEQHVVDASPAALAARTYREHRDLRSILRRMLGNKRVPLACELGAGYGRMTPVLTEAAEHVIGFEREPHLVAQAASLYPDIEFRHVDDLSVLPIAAATADLVMVFTVLQHQLDAAAERTLTEIQRILRPGGLVLLCEETDPGQRDIDHAGAVGTIGRPGDWYAARLAELSLLQQQPRLIEPTYPRQHVGHYLVFGGRAESEAAAAKSVPSPV